jgi:hypothetical protein
MSSSQRSPPHGLAAANMAGSVGKQFSGMFPNRHPFVTDTLYFGLPAVTLAVRIYSESVRLLRQRASGNQQTFCR